MKYRANKSGKKVPGNSGLQISHLGIKAILVGALEVNVDVALGLAAFAIGLHVARTLFSILRGQPLR